MISKAFSQVVLQAGIAKRSLVVGSSTVSRNYHKFAVVFHLFEQRVIRCTAGQRDHHGQEQKEGWARQHTVSIPSNYPD